MSGAWAAFTAVSLALAYLVAVPLFAAWEWRGLLAGEPYTRYLRSWTRRHRWFAVLWYASMALVVLGGLWLVWHIGPECAVNPASIGCEVEE